MNNQIIPQPKQLEFLSTPADFAVMGGSAGGGKTVALLIEGVRHVKTPSFTPVILRRTMADIKKQGGIWDESMGIYPLMHGKPTQSSYKWTFPGGPFAQGMKMQFGHIEYDKDLDSWRSASLGFIGFEEMTQFSEKQIWYMFSRNRSTTGIKPYIRGTTNPDPDHMLRQFMDWWIDSKGFAIPERSGVIRYFTKDGDDVVWGATQREVMDKVKDLKWQEVKSFTFIPASVHDNPALLDVDPGYIGNLKALSRVERGQLLEGNWNIRPAAGMYFQRDWIAGKMIDAPLDCDVWCRGWDFAATDEEENKNADRTAKVKMGVKIDGKKRIYCIAHADAFRGTPHAVDAALVQTAEQDGEHCHIRIPQDPGGAGKAYSGSQISMLSGYKVKRKPQTGKKTVRFSACSAQIEGGNVYIVRGDWNEAYFKELEGFPGPGHDDMVDATSEAFDLLRRARNFKAY